MLKRIVITTIFIIFCFSIVVAQAQKKKTLKFHTGTELSCEDCHTCKNPTASNPCLRTCPRHWLGKEVGRKLSSDQGPDMVILNELEELYAPVKFSHKLHAEMANMSKGCLACHHYTPTDASHPPCKECHSPEVIHEHIDQPGLKGAYHRQCMGCHREWSHETACEACHISKASLTETTIAEKPSSRYLPCQEPDKKVYNISYNNGPYVSFFHKNHAHLYGIQCNDCHKEDPCIRCHYQGEKPLSVVEASADLMHHKCSACHNITEKTGCRKCHSKTERKGFDHGQATGWALNIYHQKLSCRSCHPAGKPIGKLNRTCISCHSGWNSENFNHSITGIELDEIHLGADCSDCHVDRRFDKKPDCSSCHEGDKTYPKDKPGKVTKKGK